MKKTTLLLLGVALLVAPAARASVIVGGYTFADNAFVDKLASSTGNWTVSGGSLESVLVGSNPNDYAFSFDSNAELVLQFTDNVAVNGAGADLAVFELGVPDSFSLGVTVGGTTHTYATSATGFNAGIYSLNVALIDLSDFGLAPGATVSLLDVFPVIAGTSPSFTVFGALNSSPVPEPATLALLGSGLVAGFFRRRQRR